MSWRRRSARVHDDRRSGGGGARGLFAFAPRARTVELRWFALAGCLVLAAAAFQTAAGML